MWPIHLVCLLNLAAPASGGNAANAPHLDVLEGSVRVLAGETWLSLPRGSQLPASSPNTTLSLDWNTRARLTIAGAGVELRGPLEVESTMDGGWNVRMSGRGGAQFNARSTPVNVELTSSARLDLRRGAYWVEGIPAGGWRVGCDAGEPLVLRAPRGASWGRAPKLECGASLLLVPTEVVPPVAARAGRKLVAPPWASFSWPWTSDAEAQN